ncbi:MAG TPA: glycoside hydrolase family 88 protein [Roseateles sp.]
MKRRRACASLGALGASALLPARAAEMPAPQDTALAIAPQYTPAAAPLYINAMILAAQRRLGTSLLAQARAATAALRDAVGAPGYSRPSDWPRLAGYAALAEAATADGDVVARALAVQALRSALEDTPHGPRLAGLRPWTDDMFMAALLVQQTAPLLPPDERARAIAALAFALQDHARRLQRADGLFDHAEGAPIAWGRGNGFAALALSPASGLLPADASVPLRAALQRHLRALPPLQSADGAWRQVLDEAGATPELTVTAMSLTALARARRHGWLPAAEVDAPIARAWQAVRRRIGDEGRFADVCAGTPAGPTLDFYLQRPITHGRDERAAAMVLTAAIELAQT